MRVWALLSLMLLVGCNYEVERDESRALERNTARDTWLGAQVAQAIEGQDEPDGFALLANGRKAFSVRVELIHQAERTLDIQTYLFGDGQTTRLVLAELVAAAERGVRVRLLLDDMGAIGQGDQLAALASHANIEVRVFNAVAYGRGHLTTRVLASFTNPAKQHRRMHNKLWIADNSVAIAGGRNLGDEYFDANDTRNFADLDLMTIGEVVPALSQSFDDYWNHALAEPIGRFHRADGQAWQALQREMNGWLDTHADSEYFNELRQIPRTSPPWETLYWGEGQALWDTPAKLADGSAPAWQTTLLGDLVERSELSERLVLISAYFVPTEAGVQRLVDLANQGVAVDVITNSLESTDAAIVHGAYAPWRSALIEGGIRLFELRPEQEESAQDIDEEMRVPGASASALHIKALRFDEQVFIGSFNADPRSVLWNSEVGVLARSEGLVEAFDDVVGIGQAPAISYRVRLDGEDALSWHFEHNEQETVLTEEAGNWWRRLNAWAGHTLRLEYLL